MFCNSTKTVHKDGAKYASPKANRRGDSSEKVVIDTQLDVSINKSTRDLNNGTNHEIEQDSHDEERICPEQDQQNGCQYKTNAYDLFDTGPRP